MSLTRKLRSYFWDITLPIGSSYKKFRKGNKPDDNAFRYLFESLLFSANSDNTASLTVAGHGKIASDEDVINRKTYEGFGDGFRRFVQPHQLPNGIELLCENTDGRGYSKDDPCDRTITIPGDYIKKDNRLIFTILAGSTIYESENINQIIITLTFSSTRTITFNMIKGSDGEPAAEFHKYVIIVDLKDTLAYVNYIDEFNPNSGDVTPIASYPCYAGARPTYTAGNDLTVNIKTAITGDTDDYSSITIGRLECQVIGYKILD